MRSVSAVPVRTPTGVALHRALVEVTQLPRAAETLLAGSALEADIVIRRTTVARWLFGSVLPGQGS